MGTRDDPPIGAEQGRQTIERESRAEARPQKDAARPQHENLDETLRFEYQEICKSHQAITEFRGKLLGLLPLASGTGIFLLLEKTTTNRTPLLAAAGVFGVFVTIGLYFYEQRGMKECILLRERGAKLEIKLRLAEDYSQFQNNIPGFIGPQGAGPIVYFAVVAGWLFVISYGFTSSKPGWRIALLGSLIFMAYLILLRVAFLKFYYDRNGLQMKKTAGKTAGKAAGKGEAIRTTARWIRQFFRNPRRIPPDKPNTAARVTSDDSASSGS